MMTEVFLESRVNSLISKSEYDYCCGKVKNFGINENESIGSISPFKEILTYDTTISTCPSNYLFRRTFLEENNLKFSSILNSTADKYFLFEVKKQGGKGFLTKAPKSELLYRVAEGSMSNRLTKKTCIG